MPTEIKADGMKIIANLNDFSMPLSEDLIKKHCGHMPKSNAEAWAMARRLRNRVLNFPNINIGKGTIWDKRQSRIERRKRREAGVMKINIGVEIDSDIKKHELCEKLLTIEGIKKIKKVSDNSIEVEIDKKLNQKKAIETVVKNLEEDFEEIKSVKSVDFQD